MQALLTCVTQRHDQQLLLAAALVCAVGVYASSAIASHAARSEGIARRQWGLASIIASGCTAWATHMIALLAFQPGMASGFEPIPHDHLAPSRHRQHRGRGRSVPRPARSPAPFRSRRDHRRRNRRSPLRRASVLSRDRACLMGHEPGDDLRPHQPSDVRAGPGALRRAQPRLAPGGCPLAPGIDRDPAPRGHDGRQTGL